MPELHRFTLKLDQQPVYDLDVQDAAATRAWRRRCIETEVSLLGRIPLRMVLVGQGVQRTGLFEQRMEPGVEREHVTAFAGAARLPDVVRAYREGEITVDADGARYRAAVTLEYSYVTGRWWTAQRRVGTNAAQVGVLHGEWVEREGEGLDGLGEALREWVDDAGIELVDSGEAVKLTPRPEPTMGYGATTLVRQPPPDPRVYADIVARLRDEELTKQAPHPLEVYAFTGLDVEYFLLTDTPSIPMDDLVRAIAARGPAEAVAVRYMGVAEVDGESYRAVFCAVEVAGRRLDRVLALKLAEGRIVGTLAFYEERDPVGPEGCWLGVAPKHGEVDLFALGPGGVRVDA